MADDQEKKIVVVTGDVTMDWHLTHPRVIRTDNRDWQEWQEWQEWDPNIKTYLHWERGGAARLADLIKEVTTKTFPLITVKKVEAPEKRESFAPVSKYYHSHALWSKFTTGEKLADGSEKKAWRVSNFLGLQLADKELGNQSQFWPGEPNDNIFLVVLDDADLGFRDCDLAPWLDHLKQKKDAWIILKAAHPVAQGQVWKYLYENHARRLIVVIPVNDLRRTEVRISRQLSWERTAQDLLWELTYNQKINLLRNCAHLVVSFESVGAFWYARKGAKAGEAQKTLFFHPRHMEGVVGRDHRGGMIGFTTCLVASIARQVLKDPSKPGISNGIQLGLAAMRTLYLDGYQEEKQDKITHLKFPSSKIVDILSNENTSFLREKGLPSVEVKMPTSFRTKKGLWESSSGVDLWCILHDKYQKELSQRAREVVLRGPNKALKEVPVGEFGDLVTVDRQEIESFRSIRNLMRDYYCRSMRPDQTTLKPLSIAVFGPPGSGKSFGITQAARSLLPDRIKDIEFNLSQFKSPEDLLRAFHQVRDLGLKGKLPLVFWDEFDAKLQDQSWFWLRYFLAPMQDGVFQEGQISHPLGRAIFVFAGSSRHTMGGFAKPLAEEREKFKEAKGPDFVSRIKAHIDIKGPNRPAVKEGVPWTPDPFFIIRRAFMLRVLLKRHWPKLFQGGGDVDLQIDDGVLRAFLEVEEYRHGVRSMETIVATSILHGEHSFKRSFIPPEEQLDLHVDAANFLDLVYQLDKNTVEKLAAAIHETYVEYKKDTPLSKRYQELEEDEKEQNRSAARNIAVLLAQVGLMMVPSSPGLKALPLQGYVEILSKNEHQRWLKEKVDLGWKFGPKKDNDRKIHNLLLPWHRLTQKEMERWPARMVAAIGKDNLLRLELSHEAKEENRRLVEGFEKILKKAKFVIIRSGAEAEAKPLILGVTGHRIIKEEDKIEAGIREALSRIELAFPGRPLVVMSSLAEGANLLLVSQVFARPGFFLKVVLPLPPNAYLANFKTEQAKQKFLELLKQDPEPKLLDPDPDPDNGYEVQGLYILDHCDVLVAVWDGQPAQGLGGTGGIVASARRRRLPLAWVHAGNRKPGTEEPTTLGAEQGLVTLENFPQDQP